LEVIDEQSDKSAIVSMHALVSAVRRFTRFDASTCNEVAQFFSAELEKRMIATKLDGMQLSAKLKLRPEAVEELRNEENRQRFQFHSHRSVWYNLLFRGRARDEEDQLLHMR
jgi:hypothetical protein